MADVLVPFDQLLVNVVDNRGRSCPVVDSGFPLIATNCISNNRLYPTRDNVRFVDEKTYSTWFRAHPEPGDIIFVLKGAPGRCALTPDPVDFCIAQDMVAIRADREKVDPQYLFAALRSPLIQAAIDRMHVGTMIPHFKKGDFSKLLMALPDRSVQEFVGTIHMAIVRKIESNRRMNEGLESMAIALFRDWFVDFGPTHAKTEGKNPYLAAHTWGLFPDSFDQTGIPEGWARGPLSTMFEIVGGGTPKTSVSTYWDGEIPWFSVRDTPSDGSSFVHDTEKHISALGLQDSAVRMVPSGTTIISARGTVGNIAIAASDMTFNQSCYALKAKSGFGEWLVYLTARYAISQLQALAHGSVFSTITRQTFDAIPFCQASNQINDAFDQVVSPLFERQRKNGQESIDLAATRDLLLPKLMSGEITVAAVEKKVGELV